VFCRSIGKKKKEEYGEMQLETSKLITIIPVTTLQLNEEKGKEKN